MPEPRPVHPLGILAARLTALVGRAEDPELRIELAQLAELAGGLDPYVEEMTSPRSPALAALEARTRDEDWDRTAGGRLEQEMLSGHVEGQLLQTLVHATRASRVLEIGLFTGYSALAMAEALPPGGEVVALELDPDAAAIAAECFVASPAGDRVRVVVGPALETLESLAGQRFELVFVDADKAGYAAYVDRILSLDLLAPHGLIGVDNTLLQGQPWTSGERTANGAAIDAFNRTVAADPRVEQVLVPVRDGLTLIRRVAP